MGPSSKLRNNASKGWKLKEIKIEPYVGIPATNVLYIVDHCPHPNAAKLLVRWMMGEADGTGEGNKPFQTLGGWSVRDDIADTEGMCTLEDMNIVPENPAYVYDNISDLIDFCLSIAG
jgi:iron(III) transport system substrate-binding protein